MKREFLYEQNNNSDNLILEMYVSDKYNPVNNSNKGKSILTIEVRAREGYNIPHFHYLKPNNRGGCIRIDKAEYFNHGDEYRYHGEPLSSDESKILNEWLSKKHKLKNGTVLTETNWELIRDFWNNDTNKPPIVLEKQPNYSLL